MSSKNHERQRLERRFAMLLESAPDAILIVDPQGKIALANAEASRLFGYAREEFSGLSAEMLMPEQRRAAHVAHREAFQAVPRARAMGASLNLSALRKDGSEIPVEISLSPVSSDEGLWVVIAVRDLSERVHRQQLERQNERVLESSRIVRTFLANMSHELRTPLNAIIGFSELLYDQEVGPLSSAQRDFVGDILSSANHLLELINEMLDLARIEAGKLEFQPSTFPVGKLMVEVRDSMRVLAAQKKLELLLEVEAELGPVTVDPLRLKQVLLNYVANAVKFTPEGGRVVVRARGEGADAFRVEVEDTGPGIPEDQIPRLFVEFQQLESGSRRAQQGTGLGLALSKRLVEAQGGKVGVRSAVGHGSTFFAVLPRVTAA
jgi:protein-histidine pros-kinase